MLTKHYPIRSNRVLKEYLELYIPLVQQQIKSLGIENRFDIHGDHLGLQVISPQEFDEVNEKLLNIATLVKENIIHERRNNIFELNSHITVNSVEIRSIEMFEPKPGISESVLKLGIEHIAFMSPQYEEIFKFFEEASLPIEKTGKMGNSEFFKTKFLNLIEIEFRNDYLYKA